MTKTECAFCEEMVSIERSTKYHKIFSRGKGKPVSRNCTNPKRKY